MFLVLKTTRYIYIYINTLQPFAYPLTPPREAYLRVVPAYLWPAADSVAYHPRRCTYYAHTFHPLADSCVCVCVYEEISRAAAISINRRTTTYRTTPHHTFTWSWRVNMLRFHFVTSSRTRLLFIRIAIIYTWTRFCKYSYRY